MSLASLNAGSVAVLCQEAPTTGVGYPISPDNDWQIVVEHLNARNSEGNGAVWGDAVWGPVNSDDQWGALAWDHSITEDVRGISIERGGDEPYGRPRAGVMTLRLADRDGDYSPWDNTVRKIRVGSVVRVGLRSATDARADGWLPLFCGVVETDPVAYVGILAGGTTGDKFLDVMVVEPLNELASVDDNALGGVEGSGDLIVDRLVRLLEQGNVWRFGLLDHLGVDTLDVTLQSTDMAQNRLTEVYLSADSAGVSLRPDRTGAFVVEPHWNSLGFREASDIRLSEFSATSLGVTNGLFYLWPNTDQRIGDTWRISYDTETVESGNDTAHIRNDVRYTRVGGAQQTQIHSQSRGRYQRRQMVRNDLICENNTQVAAVALLDLNRWARIALRVENVQVTSTGRSEVMLVCAAADVYDSVVFLPPTSTDTATDPNGIGYVRRLRHDITPLRGQVMWTTSWAVDFVAMTNLPGEELAEV